MGRAPCCDKANVKKGPWSQEEDAKLKAFIDQHGTGGNWITLPSKAGLKRCGKSCRLRWINYLRPDIKHGNFTEEEEKIIYQLHSQIGSRWSLIAARLPGRTDNDIKNYWNTRLKKKLLDRGSVGGYRQLHPYPMPGDIYSRLGLQDQRLRFAARESVLRGQHPSYYNLYQQQQQFIAGPGAEQQHPVRTVEQNAHQPRQFSAGVLDFNEAERQRLSVIESSLMSIISTGETTASDSSSDSSFSNPVSSIEYGYPLHSSAATYDSASPGSSVSSNLSPSHTVFGTYFAGSAFVDPGYKVFDELAAQNLDASTLDHLNPQLAPTRLYDPVAPTNSLLQTHGLNDSLVFPAQGVPEVGVMKTELGPECEAAEWWSNPESLISARRELSHGSCNKFSLQLTGAQVPPSTAMRSNFTCTPRCAAENFYTSPQSQFMSQPQDSQSQQSMRSYVETCFSSLTV